MNTVFFYIIFAIEMTNLLDKPSEHHTEFHAPAVEKVSDERMLRMRTNSSLK